MNIVFATGNSGKVAEVQAILHPNHQVFTWHHLLSSYQSPVENQNTFSGNSLLKAKSLWDKIHPLQKDIGVLSDDSGIEVEVLDGKPGVDSAIYAGPVASDKKNREKLWQQLQTYSSPKDRRASMRCYLTYITHDNNAASSNYCMHQFSAAVDGHIASHIPLATNPNAFGYDPIFIPTTNRTTLKELHQWLNSDNTDNDRWIPPSWSFSYIPITKLIKYLQGKTYGQWPPGWKNKLSHRYFALKKLKQHLDSLS